MNTGSPLDDDPEFQELRRLWVLEARAQAGRLAEALAGEPPPPGGTLRAELRRAAHNLRGTGGLYGLPEVSERAGELEVLLLAETPAEALRESADRLRTALRE